MTFVLILCRINEREERCEEAYKGQAKLDDKSKDKSRGERPDLQEAKGKDRGQEII